MTEEPKADEPTIVATSEKEEPKVVNAPVVAEKPLEAETPEIEAQSNQTEASLPTQQPAETSPPKSLTSTEPGQDTISLSKPEARTSLPTSITDAIDNTSSKAEDDKEPTTPSASKKIQSEGYLAALASSKLEASYLEKLASNKLEPIDSPSPPKGSGYPDQLSKK